MAGLPLLLFMRAHAAYVGALRLVTAGHFVESYALMRNSLEHALYALYFKHHPNVGDVWLARHKGEAERAAVRKVAQIGKMLQYLKTLDGKLGGRANNVYERSIDFGAHPNFGGVVMPLEHDEATDSTTSHILSPQGRNFENSLSYITSTGLVVLELMCKTFPERTQELDLLKRTHILILRHIDNEKKRRQAGLIGDPAES